MAVITRSDHAKSLVPGLHALFGMEYGRYDNMHERVFDKNSSERAFEEEVLLVGFGAAPTKAEGASVTFDAARESYTSRYTMESIVLAYSLTEEAMEDNLYEQMGARYTKALARSMAHTKQVKAMNVFNNAFSSSFKGGDGVSLSNASHPLASGTTASNTPATQVDLSETALENAVIAIHNFTDDRDLPIAVNPRMLLIPIENQFVAERILKSDLRSSTADNDLNAIKSTGMFPDGYEFSPHISDTDSWHVLTDAPDGLKYFERTAMQTSTDGDFDSGSMKFKARERYAFGFSDWRAVFSSQGA